MHSCCIVKSVKIAGDIVHLEIFLAGLEIAGKRVEFLVYERDWHAPCGIIELKESRKGDQGGIT